MTISATSLRAATIRPVHVHAVQAVLGEGPVWLPHARALWFTDIKGRRLHRYDPEAGALRSWDAPAQPGWVLPAQGGSLVVGLQSGLHRFDPEGGLFTALHDPEPHLPENRLNDAAIHPDGSLWFGTMDDAERAPTGRLYRFAGADAADSGLPAVTITNGPAFSPDGTILYHVDTLGRTVWQMPLAGGAIAGAPTLFARIEDGAGYPDGLTVDAEGCVWMGLFGGWAVRRYAPDGRLIEAVPFPVANVTKIAFGGDDLGIAYVTTARKGLSEADRAAQPLAGDLFAFRRPGTVGLPPVRARI
jgi:xylono-1,5-lactonase